MSTTLNMTGMEVDSLCARKEIPKAFYGYAPVPSFCPPYDNIFDILQEFATCL
jgi:hypothetical protein